jgi:hypothetical protein
MFFFSDLIAYFYTQIKLIERWRAGGRAGGKKESKRERERERKGVGEEKHNSVLNKRNGHHISCKLKAPSINLRHFFTIRGKSIPFNEHLSRHVTFFIWTSHARIYNTYVRACTNFLGKAGSECLDMKLSALSKRRVTLLAFGAILHAHFHAYIRYFNELNCETRWGFVTCSTLLYICKLCVSLPNRSTCETLHL